MTSRIGKLLREAGGVSRFADAQALRAKDLALVVSDDSHIALVRSAVALVLRCFTGLVVVRTPSGRSIPRELADAAEREAIEYGSPDRLVVDGPNCELQLGLGCPTSTLFVDARGWTVYVNDHAHDNSTPATAPAAAFAAAAGVAKLFASIMGRDPHILTEAWHGALLDLPVVGNTSKHIDELDIGRLLVVGAGAIGSGFAHVLRLSGWRGDITWVDNDRYDEPNHETTLLISRRMAMRQVPKATTLAGLVRSTKLSVDAHNDKIVVGHELLARPVDAIVCAVDNAETRLCFDNVRAPLVFNAGVGGGREDAGHVLWTRHSANEPPLSFYYRTEHGVSRDTTNEPEDVVSDACSRVAYANVALAAPFMGMAAGALLAAGIAEQRLRIAAPTNYLKMDLLELQQWSTRRSLLRHTR